MSAGDPSFPAPPEDKHRVREQLPDVLAGWIRVEDVLLTAEGGWPLGPPASVSEWWSHVLYLLATATDRLAHHAAATRSASLTERENAEQLAAPALDAIDRLAAALLQRLGDQLDQDALLAEAADFVSEIYDEDDGLLHTSDTLGTLLQAEIVCADEQLPLPDSERANAAVKVLAPLLAQAACVLYVTG